MGRPLVGAEGSICSKIPVSDTPGSEGCWTLNFWDFVCAIMLHRNCRIAVTADCHRGDVPPATRNVKKRRVIVSESYRERDRSVYPTTGSWTSEPGIWGPHYVSDAVVFKTHGARTTSMAAELIDAHVSVEQCERAVTTLMEYALKQQQKREENELLPGKEEFIWLQISVKRVHAEAKLKPRRMCVYLQLCTSSCLFSG
jgi:hypothetical protein